MAKTALMRWARINAASRQRDVDLLERPRTDPHENVDDPDRQLQTEGVVQLGEIFIKRAEWDMSGATRNFKY